MSIRTLIIPRGESANISERPNPNIYNDPSSTGRSPKPRRRGSGPRIKKRRKEEVEQGMPWAAALAREKSTGRGRLAHGDNT
eukprot:scaffold5010_cov110-Isochrysis_galbana.AAC.4